jgi:hypothetical protein
MSEKNNDELSHGHNDDDLNRRPRPRQRFPNPGQAPPTHQADESTGRPTKQPPVHHQCDLRAREARPRERGFFPRATVENTPTTIHIIQFRQRRNR